MPIDTSTWIVGKAQADSDKFLGASMHVFDSMNKLGKQPPFNYSEAVKQYRGWMYAAIWMNAKAVASTPLKLYVRTGKGGKEKTFRTRAVKRYAPRQHKFMTGRLRYTPSDYVLRKSAEWGGEFEEVTEKNPVLDLINRPNPYMLGHEFSCMRSMLLQLTGNLYLHPIVESTRYRAETLSAVRQLWIMPSQYVKIQPGEANDEGYIRGFWYGVDSNSARLFEKDEVYHMKRPNPKDPLYGLGDVEAGWDVQQLSGAQRQTDFAHYANHSRPDLAVITKSMSGSAQTIEKMKELQEEWARMFRGTFRQGSPVFLTGDTSVIPLNYQPTEIGDREIIVEEIAAITGVPVTLLKANDPNLASARVGFASWREQTTLPFCRADEEFLNVSLLPAFGIEDEAFLCYDDPVPENRDEVQQETNIAMQWGTRTRNEIRIAMGDEPVDEPNADMLLVPSGLQPISKVGEAPPGFGGLTFGEPSKQPEKQPPKEEDATDEKAVLQSKAMYANHKVDADDTVRDGESEKLIRNLQLAIGRVFSKQGAACRAVIAGKKAGDASLIARVLATVFSYNDEMAGALRPFMDKILEVGGRAGFKEISLPEETWNVVNPKVAEFMRQYTIRLAGEVNRYTAERLSESLAEGMSKGEGLRGLAGRVETLYEDFSGYRSEMIARTESANAYCAGMEGAWQISDVVQGKQWLLAAGGCEVCQTVAREFSDKVVPLDEPFYPLGSVINLPSGKVFHVDYKAIMGPAIHPHDRCGLKAVLKKE